MPVDIGLRDSQTAIWRKRCFSAEAVLKFNGRRQVCRLCNVTTTSPLDRTSERCVVGKYRPCDGVRGRGESSQRSLPLYYSHLFIKNSVLFFKKFRGCRGTFFMNPH